MGIWIDDEDIGKEEPEQPTSYGEEETSGGRSKKHGAIAGKNGGKQKKKAGIIIGVIVVLALVVVAALLVFGPGTDLPPDPPVTEAIYISDVLTEESVDPYIGEGRILKIDKLEINLSYPMLFINQRHYISLRDWAEIFGFETPYYNNNSRAFTLSDGEYTCIFYLGGKQVKVTDLRAERTDSIDCAAPIFVQFGMNAPPPADGGMQQWNGQPGNPPPLPPELQMQNNVDCFAAIETLSQVFSIEKEDLEYSRDEKSVTIHKKKGFHWDVMNTNPHPDRTGQSTMQQGQPPQDSMQPQGQPPQNGAAGAPAQGDGMQPQAQNTQNYNYGGYYPYGNPPPPPPPPEQNWNGATSDVPFAVTLQNDLL